jgi:hypothetical protein
MPFSDIKFDTQVEQLLKANNFSSYLDIGAGAGKYGKLIKEIFPAAIVEGIEIEKDYIVEYNLEEIYDGIYCIDVNRYIDTYVDQTYDLCIIGDCIEHLKKSDGINLIEFLIYRSKYIVIIFPTKYIQNSWNGYKNEAHRSIWSKRDFDQYESKYCIKDNMNMVEVKGYL